MEQSSPRITYAARPGTTPEAEICALAGVYRFVIEASRKKKATRPGGPDDAERRSSDGTTGKYKV